MVPALINFVATLFSPPNCSFDLSVTHSVTNVARRGAFSLTNTNQAILNKFLNFSTIISAQPLFCEPTLTLFFPLSLSLAPFFLPPSWSTDYQSEYYGPGGNYDFFPQGPPSSQAQTPVDLPFVPSSGPTGTPLGGMDHPLPGHHPSSEVQRFSDIMSHHPGDSPSPEPGIPGPLHSISSEVFGPNPPFTSLSLNGSGYSNHLSHPPSEMNEGTVW